MASTKLTVALVLFASALVIVVESICPDEGIEPCTCEETEHRYTIMKCQNIPDIAVLEKVAENSDGYRFDQVHIENSTLQYIPKIVLENMRTKNLYLRNLTLNRVVNGMPNALDELTDIFLEEIKALNGFSWEVFNNTKNLKQMSIEKVSIPVLTQDFNTYVTHGLKQLKLIQTGTKEIRKGVFEGFGAIHLFFCYNNELKNLTRDLFPETFNIQVLDFNNNKLTSIPDDFFVGMPNLSIARFSGNLIARINEPVSGSRLPPILDVFDNPIKCDCNLHWMVKRNLGRKYNGYCDTPKRLNGKSLQDLQESDFDC